MTQEKKLPEFDEKGIVKSGDPRDIKDLYDAMSPDKKKNGKKEGTNVRAENKTLVRVKQKKVLGSICREILSAHSDQPSSNNPDEKPSISIPTITAIYNQHKDVPVFLVNGTERYADLNAFKEFRKNFSNWANCASTADILSNRAKLIDFLLYFNYKKYELPLYGDRVRAFNEDLERFGHDYILGLFDNFQEFSVRAAMKLWKEGEDLYKLFTDIYFNQELLQILEAGKNRTKLLPDYDYTDTAANNFRKTVCDFASLKKFVKRYKESFGRARIRSYHVFCLLTLGKPFQEVTDTIKKNQSWETEDMEETAVLVKDSLTSISKKVNTEEEKNLRYLFYTCCAKTVKDFEDAYSARIIAKRKIAYELEKQKNPNCSIFKMETAQSECREFLRVKYEELRKNNPGAVRDIEITYNFRFGWDDNSTNPANLSPQYMRKWEKEATEFFFAERKSGIGERIQKTWTKFDPEQKQNDLVLDSFFNRDESVSKEALLVAIALCLSAELFDKNWPNWRADIDRPAEIANRIQETVDEMLCKVGMKPINGLASPFECLFLNTLHYMDYSKVRKACEEGFVYYPIREFIFGEILQEEKYKERIIASMINPLPEDQDQEDQADEQNEQEYSALLQEL